MRTLLLTSAVAVMALVLGAPVALAQANPSADQIIRALRPTGPLQTGTRGIRPAAPTAATPPGAILPGAATPEPLVARPAAAPTAPVAALSVDLTVQFMSGSADLTPSAMRALDELGRALSSEALAAFRFRIEGHTDTTGSRDMNMTLSQARAARVAEYLQSKYGVAGARLEPVGRGQEALRVPTPEQTAEPRNRRVQVINIGA